MVPSNKRVDGYQKILIASDLHGPFLDRRCYKLFLNVVDDFCPDMIILNGDVADFSQISSHDRKIRMRGREFQEEVGLDEELFMIQTEIFRPLRLAAPTCKIIMRKGNHDVRWELIAETNREALAQMMKTMRKNRSLYLEDVLGLPRFKIEMDHRPIMRLTESFTLIHGVKTNKMVAKANLLRFGSGTSGHTHRMGTWTEIMHGQLQSWNESGCLRTIDDIEYLPFGDKPDWANGFLDLRINFSTGKFFCTPHFIIKNECEFHGKIYRV
jgi:predicted phosphodiesterase